MGWLDNVGGNIAGWMHGQDESGFIPPQNQNAWNQGQNAWNQGQGKGGTLSYNKQNQLVNEQGQLVDRDGNVIDDIESDENKIVNGKDATLKTINNQFNGAANGDEYNKGLVNKYNEQFNGATNGIDKDNAIITDEDGNEQFQDDSNEIVGKIDDIKTTDSDDQGGRKRPFQSLFSGMRENWQRKQAERQDRRNARPERGKAGFRNIGSAEFDEEGFIEDPNDPTKTIPNPNYGKYKRDPNDATKIIGKGEGLFGKEGGFMSKFGTGRGAMSGLLGGVGEGIAQAGSDLMQSGGYQYGDFYNRDDDRRY
jgi:hypothetical protein